MTPITPAIPGLSPEIVAQAVALAQTNGSFLAELQSDAGQAIAQHFGVTAPTGLVVHTQDDRRVLVKLSGVDIAWWNLDGELSDDELEMAGGGCETCASKL